MTTNKLFPVEAKASILSAIKAGNTNQALSLCLQAIEELSGDTSTFREECEAALPGEAKMLSGALAILSCATGTLEKHFSRGKTKEAEEYLESCHRFIAKMSLQPNAGWSAISDGIPQLASRELESIYARLQEQEARRDRLRDTLYVDEDGKVRVHY